jgi:hypothetical protein
MRAFVILGLFVHGTVASSVRGAEPGALTPIQKELVQHIDGVRDELIKVNQDVWTSAGRRRGATRGTGAGTTRWARRPSGRRWRSRRRTTSMD